MIPPLFPSKWQLPEIRLNLFFVPPRPNHFILSAPSAKNLFCSSLGLGGLSQLHNPAEMAAAACLAVEAVGTPLSSVRFSNYCCQQVPFVHRVPTRRGFKPGFPLHRSRHRRSCSSRRTQAGPAAQRVLGTMQQQSLGRACAIGAATAVAGGWGISCLLLPTTSTHKLNRVPQHERACGKANVVDSSEDSKMSLLQKPQVCSAIISYITRTHWLRFSLTGF